MAEHDHDHPHNGELDPMDDSPSRHAFIMLGRKTLFLCHMTMFDHEDHCYQLILQVKLPDEAMALYLKGLDQAPLTTYFLGNSKKDEFIVPDIASGERRTFLGDIFRGVPNRPKCEGWPWDGQSGYMALPDVRVTVERVVYSRHFDFGIAPPPLLTYILFGAGDEAHMNSYQTPEPDFDHVLTLNRAPEWLLPGKLRMGVHVALADFKRDPTYLCTNPLAEGTEVNALYHGQGTPRKIAIGRTWWCSAAVVNKKDPCAKCGCEPSAGHHHH